MGPAWRYTIDADVVMRPFGGPVGEPGFPNTCRIGLGTRAENTILVKTLDAFLSGR